MPFNRYFAARALQANKFNKVSTSSLFSWTFFSLLMTLLSIIPCPLACQDIQEGSEALEEAKQDLQDLPTLEQRLLDYSHRYPQSGFFVSWRLERGFITLALIPAPKIATDQTKEFLNHPSLQTSSSCGANHLLQAVQSQDPPPFQGDVTSLARWRRWFLTQNRNQRVSFSLEALRSNTADKNEQKNAPSKTPSQHQDQLLLLPYPLGALLYAEVKHTLPSKRCWHPPIPKALEAFCLSPTSQQTSPTSLSPESSPEIKALSDSSTRESDGNVQENNHQACPPAKSQPLNVASQKPPSLRGEMRNLEQDSWSWEVRKATIKLLSQSSSSPSYSNASLYFLHPPSTLQQATRPPLHQLPPLILPLWIQVHHSVRPIMMPLFSLGWIDSQE